MPCVFDKPTWQDYYRDRDVFWRESCKEFADPLYVACDLFDGFVVVASAELKAPHHMFGLLSFCLATGLLLGLQYEHTAWPDNYVVDIPVAVTQHVVKGRITGCCQAAIRQFLGDGLLASQPEPRSAYSISKI